MYEMYKTTCMNHLFSSTFQSIYIYTHGSNNDSDDEDNDY